MNYTWIEDFHTLTIKSPYDLLGLIHGRGVVLCRVGLRGAPQSAYEAGINAGLDGSYEEASNSYRDASGPQRQSAPSNTLFVKGIPLDRGDEDLSTLFAGAPFFDTMHNFRSVESGSKSVSDLSQRTTSRTLNARDELS